jgi:hypothetical protein
LFSASLHYSVHSRIPFGIAANKSRGPAATTVNVTR